VQDFYKPLDTRTVDSQYKDRIKFILHNGDHIPSTPQGIGARMCFGTLPQMVFDFPNGVPLITERKIGFWKKPIAEICAFINGVRTVDGLEEFGCNFWEDYREKGSELGLEIGDLGSGSYGSAFHDFEIPGGGTLDQFAQVIEQIKEYPNVRTHLVTPWKPYYTARGCHGWLHFRVVRDELDMVMWQRSADFPIGVPSNMIQYAALLLMVCQVTGYKPGKYIHQFSDAHIYDDQVDNMNEMVDRESFPFPTLHLDPSITDIHDFRPEHFTLEDYTAGKAMKIPYRP
jgi:thymidylate synthase